MSLLPKLDGAGRLRWLFVTSLVLNVFFVGAAGAVAFRYGGAGTVPLSNVAQINRDVANRLNEIAASLPAADAEVMRAELRANAEKVASAQADLRLSREDLRDNLRAEPFDASALRTAMAANRTARENFELVLNGVRVTGARRGHGTAPEEVQESRAWRSWVSSAAGRPAKVALTISSSASAEASDTT